MEIISLLIGHYIGDYLFQSKKLAENKDGSYFYLLFHCLIYSVSIFFCSIFWGNFIRNLLISFYIGCNHFVIDTIKKNFDRNNLSIYILDQIVHVAVIAYFSQHIGNVNNLGYLANQYIQHTFPNLNLVSMGIVLSAYLFCMQPAGFAIRIFMKNFELDKISNKSKHKKEQADAGLIIGILERLCTLTLVLLSEYDAILFVITVKTLGRIKALSKKRKFAERYIIGTLLSLLVAMISGCLVLYLT